MVTTPIVARGDYGQWLMTSRYYLGQPIPDYRDVTALPPAVPIFLAVVALVVPDPVITLEMLNGSCSGACWPRFYLLGAALLSGHGPAC